MHVYIVLSVGYGLPLQICNVRLIQHGDVFEEVSPSVRHELVGGMKTVERD